MRQLLDYDHYIICFSGGKDCTAAFLHLIELGVPLEKMELWHHLIDGKDKCFMDWPVTEAYCRAFAKKFNVPIHFSWKEGGFKREMLRENDQTAPIFFETPDGKIGKSKPGNGKKTTRRKFPQVSADLKVRWCSAYLKIDVCTASICNQARFHHKKILVISGERGEESPCRARYKTHEPDRSDNRYKGTYQTSYTATLSGKKKQITRTITLGKNDREVDRFRPVKDWKESEVWAIIKRHQIRVHPCYYLGWSRCSCQFCIFGNADQFASAAEIGRLIWQELVAFEKDFRHTMKRNATLTDFIKKGKPYKGVFDDELRQLSQSTEYPLPITVDPWVLPPGAFAEGSGPT
ncbi:phosphoadenosine phosphosulfate reductase family protein [Cyclobacterium sp.]|uniref:phosphoadenosine phosphosulfate reductase domain-containing protein n=1 Tax=Cyclobacterium sp. TaxID=1966343 RepID=UPI001993DC04|nr:phosphoadenosine phosphosulfate reductase family protein [Cyclobacterium sp.]MBD3627630.1 phosphoadenosine phosphosulfate reductase family protein [Cyclobacterium sp.]